MSVGLSPSVDGAGCHWGYSQVPICLGLYFLPGILVTPLCGHTLTIRRELSKLSMAGKFVANLPIFLFVVCATPNLIIRLAD